MSDLEQQETEWEEKERALRAKGWPQALIKALSDRWDYALATRTGLVVRFGKATYVSDEWVLLGDAAPDTRPLLNAAKATVNLTGWDDGLPELGRGIEIRVADIVWAADGGH